MEDFDFLLDPVTPKILMKLHPSGIKRYTDLREELNLSDSSLTNRLNELERRKLICATLHAPPRGRKQIVYQLTDLGKRVVRELNLHDFLESLNRLSVTETA